MAWAILQNAQGLDLLFISHDRSFIDKIATPFVGTWPRYLRSYDVTKQAGNVNKGYARYQELKEQQLSAEEKPMPILIKTGWEEVWIRQGIKARRTRNEGRVRALKLAWSNVKSRREQQVGQVNISWTMATTAANWLPMSNISI